MAATLPAAPYDDKAMPRNSGSGRPAAAPRKAKPFGDIVFSMLSHGAAILTLALLAAHHGVAGHRRLAGDHANTA